MTFLKYSSILCVQRFSFYDFFIYLFESQSDQEKERDFWLAGSFPQKPKSIKPEQGQSQEQETPTGFPMLVAGA